MSDIKERYDKASAVYYTARGAYSEAIYNMVGELIRERFPTASTLQVDGSINEEGVPILRIDKILDAEGTVLADTEDPQEEWEEFIDNVDMEYLDVLADITGDDYLGHHDIDVAAPPPRPEHPEHAPFSVAVTLRGVCEDRTALMNAARETFFHRNSADVELVDGWDAATAIGELLSYVELPGVEVIELEPSHSGEVEVGLAGDD